MLLILLQVLCIFFRDSPVNQENFADIKGFSIIAYLISRASLDNISLQVITSFQKIYQQISCKPLKFQMIKDIFFNIRLWIYLPIQLQREIFPIIENIPIEDILNVFSFREIILLIHSTLWTKFCDSSYNLLSEPKIHPITHEIETKRPENPLLFRDSLWKIANSLSMHKLTEYDIETLFSFSFDASDQTLSLEILSNIFLFLKRCENILFKPLKKVIILKCFSQLLFPMEKNSNVKFYIYFLPLTNLNLKKSNSYFCSFFIY